MSSQAENRLTKPCTSFRCKASFLIGVVIVTVLAVGCEQTSQPGARNTTPPDNSTDMDTNDNSTGTPGTDSSTSNSGTTGGQSQSRGFRGTDGQLSETEMTREEFIADAEMQLTKANQEIEKLRQEMASLDDEQAKQQLEEKIIRMEEQHQKVQTQLNDLKAADQAQWPSKRDEVIEALEQLGQLVKPAV